MVEHIARWDNATVGQGNIVNDVLFAYNDFGQPTENWQSHSGAVNVNTTPKVGYTYADGSNNTIRPTGLIYPDGRQITLDYGTAGGMDDAASRIAAIVDDDVSSTHLADYSYLGLGPARGLLPTVNSPFTPGAVEVDYTEPDIRYTLVGTAGGNDPDTGDIYRGYDRFGRVKDCYWYDYGTSTDVDRIQYGYDRNGNRIWRENTVAASYGRNFDELYGYDLIDRLKTMERGDLNANNDAVSNLQFAQDWTLDATGNWRNLREDDDGDAAWDLDQQRTANQVNEITGITETAGPSWVTSAYNRAGNMTTIPKPADPTQSFSATYDAWNRLVKMEESGSTVAEYQYDGAKRRTIEKTYSGGQADEVRHFFYTEPSRWQVIEERVNTSTAAERQFVWGLRYIDDILLRDRDTTGNGNVDERLYGMQDANGNVTAITNEVGTIEERYAYSGYGSSRILTGSFSVRPASAYDWEPRFGGYRLARLAEFFQIRNRIYAPVLGAWLQRDPLSYSAGELNLYRYLGSRPTFSADPSGLQWLPPEPPTLTGYGYFCGPNRRADCMGLMGAKTPKLPPLGNPWPIDALDAACMAHDCCLADPYDFFLEYICGTKTCNAAFTAAVTAVNCGLIYPNDSVMFYHCEHMKQKALNFF